MSANHHALPSRYRHPVDDPDPALARPYRALFDSRLPPPLPGMVERLGRALLEADPLADEWLRVSRGLGREAAESMLAQASQHGVATVRDAPAALVQLFEQLEAVPPWLELEKLRVGAIAYRRTGVLGHFVLSDFGLMGGYRSAAVAKTLMMTGKLAYGAAERLINTGRFVTAATEPCDILPGKHGYAFTIKVRMVHAMVRAGLLRSPAWQTEAWGIPINQADTLGTNLLFSIGFVEGCKQWGLRFSSEEVDAIIHLWRYVGYLIGIDQPLLPTDEASAQSALYLVGVSQPDPDADSRALAKALYEVPFSFERPAWAEHIVRVEMALRLSMTRQILGDEGVDQLGLPRTRLRVLLPPITKLISGVELARQRIPGASYLAYRLGDFVIKKGQQLLDLELAAQKAGPRQSVSEPTSQLMTSAA
ncbi:MAG: hypothetical protein JWN48_5926 [Myxococcaceae bacterium]|nr:hypothetical protein [Myxococcaceae bacterium]